MQIVLTYSSQNTVNNVAARSCKFLCIISALNINTIKERYAKVCEFNAFKDTLVYRTDDNL